MQNFLDKLKKIAHQRCIVMLDHVLFDKQIHYCDDLQLINDNRIGVILKGQEIYIDKHQIKHTTINGNIYIISSNMLTMKIIKQ